jgi:hypothetical protein
MFNQTYFKTKSTYFNIKIKQRKVEESKKGHLSHTLKDNLLLVLLTYLRFFSCKVFILLDFISSCIYNSPHSIQNDENHNSNFFFGFFEV